MELKLYSTMDLGKKFGLKREWLRDNITRGHITPCN